MKHISLGVFCVLFACPVVFAQRAPEAGYVLPAAGKAGTTVDVTLGGYNWTADVEYFVSDPRVRIVPTGPPGPILIPGPPYWFGAKARLASLPIPRETSAKLIIPPEVPPGPIYWQVANANGVSSPVAFLVSASSDILEMENSVSLQPLAGLPAVVSGRLLKNEEVDRYTFTATNDGPITCDLQARRLGSKFLGILEVRDAQGQLVADLVGSHGADPILTFAAKAKANYIVSVRDLDFAGDRAFVYRLSVFPGPRILAARPAAGKRGESQEIEFVVANGAAHPELIKRRVTFPQSGSIFEYRLETQQGLTSPFPLFVSPHSQTIAPPQDKAEPLVLPGGFTGLLETPDGEHRYLCSWQKGEVWSLSLNARKIGSPLDVTLVIYGPPEKDGGRKEVARSEDLPATTDAGLEYTVPVDGLYEVIVSDAAGKTGSPTSIYHLEIRQPEPEFALRLTAPKWNVPLGSKTDLTVKALRTGGFKGPISLTLRGLPDGMAAPADLLIPADKSDLTIPLTAAENSGASAAVVALEGAATIADATVKRTALAAMSAHLITRDPDENLMPTFVVAATMKQRFKGRPVDQDTGRKVPRGSTHPAEITIERLDGFAGEITLQMAAQQSYAHQGISGGEVNVPPGVNKTFYPCFMPEWLESTRTSRMAILAVSKVADPKGNVRVLASDISGFVTMTMEGALLKVSCDDGERQLPPGTPFDVNLRIARLTKLSEPVRIELIATKEFAGQLKCEPQTNFVGQEKAVLRVTPSSTLTGFCRFTVRATALQEGKYLVMSEAHVAVDFAPATSTRRD